MPTPFAAMAALAAELGDFDASDGDGVEAFYVTVFPAFEEEIREEIMSWLTSVDSDFAPAALTDFVASLRQRRDFAIKHTDIVVGMAGMNGRADEIIGQTAVL